MRTGGVAGSVIARSVVARSVVGVAVVVGLAAQTACALAPSTAGKPCASDLDCPGPFYCQLEVEPRVCLPGDFVLPERSNRAPVLVEGLVVARAGEGPSRAASAPSTSKARPRASPRAIRSRPRSAR